MSAPPHLSNWAAASASQSLAPDSGSLAGRRLGTAAALAAAVHLIYTVLYQTVWIDQASAIGLGAGVLGLLCSAAVAVYLLKQERSASRVARVAVVYEVLLALSLAVSETWSVRYDAPSPQVSWGSVLLVLFPFLIPARPSVVLGASVLAAAMTPLAMALVFGLTGRDWPPLSVAGSFILPPFLCAILAWAPTRVLSQLVAAVQRARTLGNYELTEKLGAGGMGEVWLAKHRLLARPAAVKLIKPEVLGAKDQLSRERMIRRFEREAQVTATLESPHTVELYDFGVSPDGTLFYVMELLHGVDLETLVERFGPLPSERVVYLLMQACDSLDDAHGRGLIHRDIKPANLFVSRKGSTLDFVKLLDFGLVKRWDNEETESLVTSVEASAHSLQETALGQIVGTPSFLAPEAALGEQAADQRADLYALGCVGYWMLTGQLVFNETTVVAMALAHIAKEPQPPSERTNQPIAPELERLLMSCLHKDREKRPASAEALRQALAAIPLAEPWSRARSLDWWRQHLPKESTRPRAEI